MCSLSRALLTQKQNNPQRPKAVKHPDPRRLVCIAVRLRNHQGIQHEHRDLAHQSHRHPAVDGPRSAQRAQVGRQCRCL